MRKAYLFMMITLDGFFEGENGEIDWHNVDAEFNSFAIRQLDQTDVILFGRKTYELMAGYWPTPQALDDDPRVAERMNGKQKVVFSRSLEKAGWDNTRLVKENAADEIAALKKMPGKDIAVFGSSNLSVFLLENRLLDELRIMVNPSLLGTGHPLLGGLGSRVRLKLLDTKIFGSGNVLLTFRPEY